MNYDATNTGTMKQTLRLGIWGFGRVGKAAALFFARQGHQITIMDSRVLTAEEQELLTKNQIAFIPQDNPTAFFESHDIILPSPGIDLAPWKSYSHKTVTELDLFSDAFKGSLVAITGTVGKTTSTTLLSQLLTAAGRAPLTGGNIGIPMFTLLTERSSVKDCSSEDCSSEKSTTKQQATALALLEVSSFQLEGCRHFAPDLAIWTNFFSNHLDRHANLDEYFQAKKQIFNHQHASQHALLNADLVVAYPELLEIPAIINLFTTQNLLSQNPVSQNKAALSLATGSPAVVTMSLALPQLPANSSLFFIADRTAYVTRNGTTQALFSLDDISVITFPENLLVVGAALHLLGCDPAALFKAHDQNLSVPEHRLEPCARYGTSIFYNDSKATTPQATLAAVKQLAPKPIKLFLGGLGKGIDREPMIRDLAATTVRHIYCFGKEAEHLASLCATYEIAHSSYKTLEPALADCIEALQPDEQVLFSPSGSSFDLFKDFEDRGRIFKQLTRKLLATQNTRSENQGD
jgi:UDP-N-acetylmuramoylalanine--D-glutamate ligase